MKRIGMEYRTLAVLRRKGEYTWATRLVAALLNALATIYDSNTSARPL